jgi:hypothetical protein
MQDPCLAVLRFEKLKDRGGLAAAGAHLVRARCTPNADPTRKVEILAGSSNPAQACTDLIAALPRPPRGDTVLAIEAVLSASPQYFRPANATAAGEFDEPRMRAWAAATLDWLRKEFGERNVASAVLHLDESTPHIHALIVPLDDTPRKKGPTPRLNAKRWLGDREKLAAMQDSYALALVPLGIERGIRGSKAKHQDIRRYYGELPAREARLDAREKLAGLQAAAMRAGMRAYIRGELRTAADGVIIFRSPADQRRLESIIAPDRFGVWATLRRVQGLIERRTSESLELLTAPKRPRDQYDQRQHYQRELSR